ncbi:ABC transporter substrate-binding protein [Sulfurimonas sp.]|uniref:ABC transporter substrate-binding protein n=1 Tax=Sulfurimonas sp. TaxID=2022749 RepID=UPI0025F8509B|nr:ABC transporter substrate-binding protein [Sulfurimonas sp.]
MIKRITLVLMLLLSISAQASQKMEKLIIAGPFASVSHPIMHMIETGALSDVADKVEFKLWKNPDELRALVLNSEVPFIAVPTNAAAILYNKGVDIKLLNVSVWGILGIVSRDKSLKTIEDFKGKELAMPFRADMPDIVFEQLVKAQGMDIKKDFKLKYFSSPIDAMRMLLAKRIDHALLMEPATSMAFRKSKSFPLKEGMTPSLYRSVNLQEAWGKTFKVEAKIPQAGMAFLGKTKGKEHLINRFNQEYAKSLKWYKSHPKEAAKLTVKTLNMLGLKGLQDSIPHINFEFVNAQDAKKDVEFFFDVLKQNNPKVVGGKLPNDGFYYKK